MKLSFSLTSKSQSKKPGGATSSDAAKAFEISHPQPASSTANQFVTEFDPAQLSSSQTLIIPPKPNEYRPFKKMRNLELPLTDVAAGDSHPLQFELESASNDVPDGSISYGLNVRQSNGNTDSNGALRADPMLVKYKEDMGRLPDVPGFEEFEDMPVDGFGAALLSGYGWKEGRGIGRNAKEDVKIVEYKKWTGKEGLGFQREAPERVISGKRDGKKDAKGGDQVRVESVNGGRDQKGHMDAGKDAREVDGRDGSRSRERRDRTRESSSTLRGDRDGRDEELKDGRKKERKHRGSENVGKQSEDVGMEAREVDGTDGSSSSRERRDKARENSSSRRSDRDDRDEELKDGRKKERKHRGSKDAEQESKDVRMEGRAVGGRDGSSNSRERRDRTRENISSSSRSDRNGRDEALKDSRTKERKHRGSEDVEKLSTDVTERGSQQPGSERVIWLFSHIRVRVISKAVKGGTLYLKKGEVVDVVGPSCDILMDESRELVQGVGQKYLETALPKRGGPVLVLYGKHKGVYGTLVEKDSDKETGVVRDADNHEMFNVRLEQIAEFIGDPSYIGY